MSWMEGKLQPIDLLSALQLKMRGGQGGQGNQRDGSQGQMAAMQKLLAEEQLKAAQEANKMAELKRALLTPTGMPNATDSPYSQGYPDYAKAQERDKLLSLMNGGKAYTGIGDIGNGGGYGGGGGGGNLSYADQMKERQRQQSADQLALNEGLNPAKPDPFNTFMQITQGMKSQGQPGGENSQPGSKLDNPYYPTNTNESSVSGSPNPYNPNDVKGLLVEQMLNKDGLTSLANQAGLPQNKTDKITSGIDKELLNIMKPINALTTAKQNEIDNYISGVNPSMNDNLVPAKVQQHYKKEKTIADNNKKLADKKKSLEKQSQDELGRQIETHGAALYKDIAWAGDSKNDIAPTILDDVKQKMKSALPLYLKAAKVAGEAFDLARFKRDFGY